MEASEPHTQRIVRYLRNANLLHRHTLREILWLIDISTELLRDPHTHEPEWDEWEKWREKWMSRRHFDTVIIESHFTLISDSHDTEDDTISSFYLFHIRSRLLS